MKTKHTKYRKAIVTSAIAFIALSSTAQINNTAQAVIGNTFADSKEYWAARPKAPQGASNIIWILLDDVGFGASDGFGGLIPTPNFGSLANNGLRYTNFHTTGICAPSRAALLTGRNSSRVHEAGFSHVWGAFGFPGWDGRIPSTAGTIAEILKANGYNTFGTGKWGLTPDQDTSDAGPFDYWPNSKGFEHYFGFLYSQDDQYKTHLFEDNANIKPDGRHFSEQITDKAISYIDKQQNANSGKPFFLYYAPGATHAPHQVPDEWRDIYKGKFDKGWDWYREEAFKRQKQLGIIPKDAVLPARNPNIKAWDSLSVDEKRLYARFFEVYAAYLSYTDHEIGRLIQHLKDKNVLDNTLVVVMIGDNGASKEGNDNGIVDQNIIGGNTKGPQSLAYNLAHINDIGKPEGTQVNYPLGWAQAANAPFRFWKSDANAEGGTRNPLIIYFPQRIKSTGIRNQYAHIIDILPTTLEIAGIHAPEKIGGIAQDTIQGTSLVYSFENPGAPSRHTVQYYYIYGSRAIYKDGWKASFAFETKSPFLINNYSVESPGHNDWQLYNVDKDYTERIDLAKKYPEKLTELKALFDEEAKRNNLYPLITWDDVIQQGIKVMKSQNKK
ncbi:MAG: arylsulfatase [Arachidicoccus sp.]|nr:arylsulfatase [Arachidicoccus sp.]